MASTAERVGGVVSDAELIAGSVEDPSSFASVFDRHYDAIARYLSRRLERSLAEQLAGEVFIRAFAQRESYDLRYPDAAPWLYGIAGNLLVKHVREEGRRRRAYARVAKSDAAENEATDVEARVDAEARAPALAAALARLRPADRETLLLFALADLDYDSIARATDVPVGTVRSRLHRARRCIRVELGLTEPKDL